MSETASHTYLHEAVGGGGCGGRGEVEEEVEVAEMEVEVEEEVVEIAHDRHRPPLQLSLEQVRARRPRRRTRHPDWTHNSEHSSRPVGGEVPRRAAAATSPTRADLPRPRRWRGQACTAGAGPREAERGATPHAEGTQEAEEAEVDTCRLATNFICA